MQPRSKELKRGVVTYAELIFQSISFTAPAIAVTATMTGAAAFAYGSLPLEATFLEKAYTTNPAERTPKSAKT